MTAAARRSRGAGPAAGTGSPIPWWGVALAVAAWVVLWSLTPGLLEHGVGSLLSTELGPQVLIESALALVVLALIALLLPRRTARPLAPSHQMWAYTVPAALAIALPFYYSLPAPVGIYIVWMAVSVLWQQLLTFGLLQDVLRERLPAWATILVVSAIFWAGHAVWLPDRFGFDHPVAGLGIVAMGLVVSSLRAWLGVLHIPLALHLTFYYLFA